MIDPVRKGTTLVVGPAYLDRVLRLDEPLLDPSWGVTVDGGWQAQRIGETDTTPPTDRLTIIDQQGSQLIVTLPEDWPGPWGELEMVGAFPLTPAPPGWCRLVHSSTWQDDLGGMGAGFAAALHGDLISVLGPAEDSISQQVETKLQAQPGLRYHPIRVDHPADWTLILSSGRFGDKLALGFRGAHNAWSAAGFQEELIEPTWDRLVLASLDNRQWDAALHRIRARVTMAAPTRRTMVDRSPPLTDLAPKLDLLCCHQAEWDALPAEDQDHLLTGHAIELISLTEGAKGSTLWWNRKDGFESHKTAAFPRQRPPQDTNRAGEAYAAALLLSLWEAGWWSQPPRGTDARSDCLSTAMKRAAAAASCVLDQTEFGFPSRAEWERSLRAGSIA